MGLGVSGLSHPVCAGGGDLIPGKELGALSSHDRFEGMLPIPLLAELCMGLFMCSLLFVRYLGPLSSGFHLAILYFSKKKHKMGKRTQSFFSVADMVHSQQSENTVCMIIRS